MVAQRPLCLLLEHKGLETSVIFFLKLYGVLVVLF